MFTTLRCVIFSFAILSVSTHTAFVRPKLTKEEAKACQGAMAERKRLNTSNLRQLLQKGPQKESQSLENKQLSDLRRLIELDEQVMFKCRLIAHPDIHKKRPNQAAPVKQQLSMAPPSLPVRNPKIIRQAMTQPSTLPLPARRPKWAKN